MVCGIGTVSFGGPWAWMCAWICFAFRVFDFSSPCPCCASLVWCRFSVFPANDVLSGPCSVHVAFLLGVGSFLMCLAPGAF